MKKIIVTILILVIIIANILPTISIASEKLDNIQSFEENVPNYWKAKTGSLEISPKHYKHKENSLLWKWKQEDIITVTEEKNLVEAGNKKSGGMIMWIYNEEPLEDKIVFNFGTKEQINNKNPLYTFDCYLNFKGWRAIWIKFRDDATNPNFVGKRKGNLEQMQIIAPTKKKEGTLYFDLLEFRESMYWDRSQDYQVTVDRTSDGKGQTWQRHYYYMQKKPYIEFENISKEQKNAFATIDKRLQEWIYGTGRHKNSEEWKLRKKKLDSYISGGVRRYENLDIQIDEENNITGKPLFSNVSPYISTGTTFGDEVASNIFLPLALDYKINGNKESLTKVMTVFDYYYDQGWAEGSGIGSLNHETNRTTGYFIAVYLLKDELKATGRLERELGAVEWYSTFGKLYVNPEVEYEETTADELRTQSLNRLIYVLLQENSNEKLRDMKSYIIWLNEALRVNPNLADTIKPDFTGYHHQGVYMNGYAPQGYHLISVINYLLHDTVFELDQKAQYNLKQALITFDNLTNGTQVPFSLRGRLVSSIDIIITILPSYAYMALSGNPETGEEIDKEMAQIFIKNWNIDKTALKNTLLSKCYIDISYVNTMGAIDLMLDIVELDIESMPEKQGVWSKPYAGFMFQKKNKWMTSVKGWSKYIWDFESQAKANAFGRYMSYGMFQIYSKGNPTNDKSNGYDFSNGWDWNRMPGTTTKHLTLEELSKGSANNFSDQTFLGGVTINFDKNGSIKNNMLNGSKEGTWGMILHDTTFDTSFYAKKSVFFFDDLIVFLGSNINNNDTQNNTETTLFQCNMNEENMPIYINSKENITEYPYKKNGIENEKMWIIDPYGNGYYIPNSKNIEIIRDTQQSRDHTNSKDTNGKYTTAWINHGKAPKDEDYEYAIKVDTTVEEMQNYVNNISYNVIQKDENAHIVKNNKSGTTGYVIFNKDIEIKDDVIKKTDTPIFAMTKQNDNELILSVSDPDLRVSNTNDLQESTKKKVKIQINGEWEQKEENSNIRVLEVKDRITTIEIDCINGETVQSLLKKTENKEESNNTEKPDEEKPKPDDTENQNEEKPKPDDTENQNEEKPKPDDIEKPNEEKPNIDDIQKADEDKQNLKNNNIASDQIAIGRLPKAGKDNLLLIAWILGVTGIIIVTYIKYKSNK